MMDRPKWGTCGVLHSNKPCRWAMYAFEDEEELWACTALPGLDVCYRAQHTCSLWEPREGRVCGNCGLSLPSESGAKKLVICALVPPGGIEEMRCVYDTCNAWRWSGEVAHDDE